MPKKRTFLPYTKARAFARSLRLKNRTEWSTYAKNNKQQLEAECVPASPDSYYASPKQRYDSDRGYKDPRFAAPAFYRVLAEPSANLLRLSDANLRSLARELAETLQQYLAGQDVWERKETVWTHLRSLVRSALSRRGYSSHTAVTIAEQILQQQADTLATAHMGSWVSWHDWLGSSYAPRMNAQFLPLNEFIAFLKKRHLTTQLQYQRWRKKHIRTPDYRRTPGAPSAKYEGFSWKTVSATTKVVWSPTPQGKGGAQPQHYAPFGQVRKAVRALKLGKREHWVAFVKDHPEWLRDNQCPRHPERVAQYSDRWHGWADFLGSDTRARQRYKLD